MRPVGAWLAGWLALASMVSMPSTAQLAAPGEQRSHVAIAPHVHEAAQRFGMPESWILAVIRAESAGRIDAVSRAGAMGLMQLMPATWARQRARFALGEDPFDPRDNILAGTSYLREMYDRYGVEGFLAAYNAGPGRYEDWRAGRRALPSETRRYVATLAGVLQDERIAAAARLQPAGAAGVAGQQSHGGMLAHPEPVEVGLPGNPFARGAQPAHDLFAPVSTVRVP